MQADVLAQTAPWPIPMGAKITQQQKVGYQQIAFSWREQGWLYERPAGTAACPRPGS
ncbi:MAG: hypothetical protein ACFN0Y_00625 [Lactobacillus sp.]